MLRIKKVRTGLANRFILFLALILILISLASCGDKKTPEKPQAVQTNPEQKKEIQSNSAPTNTEKEEEIRKIEPAQKDSPAVKARKSLEAEQLINDAIQHIDNRDYETALKYLEKGVKIGEEIETPFPKACYLAGIIYMRFKDYQNAALYYEKYLQNPDKNKARIMEMAADMYYDWGTLYDRFFESALNLHLDYYTYGLRMIPSISPRQKEAIRYFRGLGYYLSGSFDKAIDDLEKVNKIGSPFDAFARIKLGACYYEKGEKKTAESIWSKIGGKANQNDLVSSELLLTYMEVGKPVKANEVSIQQQKVSQWLEDKRVAHERNMAMANLLAISAMKDELDQAIKIFKREELVNPDMSIPISRDSEANFYGYSIFRTMSRIYFLKAAQYYRECIKATPQKTVEFNYKIGLCLLYVNKIDEAIKSFSQISSNPFKVKGEIYTAACLYQKGNRQNAEEIWDRIAKENLINEDKDIWHELSYVYSRLSIHTQDAMDYAYKINDPIIIAYAHYQMAMRSDGEEEGIENFTQAAKWFDKSRDTVDFYLDSNNPVVLVELANAYYHLHTYDESARIWAHLMDTYPEVYQIFEAIQLINKIWQMNRSEEFRSRWVNPMSQDILINY